MRTPAEEALCFAQARRISCVKGAKDKTYVGLKAEWNREIIASAPFGAEAFYISGGIMEKNKITAVSAACSAAADSLDKKLTKTAKALKSAAITVK